MKKLTIEDMQKIAEAKGGKCLSKEYVNSQTKLKWQCSKGHKWEAMGNNIRQGCWCPVCANKNNGSSQRKTIEDVQELAEAKGGKCLSTEYVNSRTKYDFICSKDHKFSMVYGTVQQGSWCPECSSGILERMCRVYFEQLFNKPFPKIRPLWLKNDKGFLLELDGYCEELGIAFEHQGKQHYERLPYFQKTIEDFNKQQQNDETKRKVCLEHNVILIEIPELYTITPLKGLQKLIGTQLENKGYTLPENFNGMKVDLSKSFAPDDYLKKMQKLAEAKKGKCLSKIYINSKAKYDFICSKGHKFSMTYDSLKRGYWCSQCACNKRAAMQRKTIENVQQLAESRGFKCVSKMYINSKTKYDFICSKGHKFSLSYDHLNRGVGCFHCAGNRRKTIEDVHQLAEAKGRKCLSTKYINSSTKYDFICSKGHKFSMSYDNLKQGKGCATCAGKNKTIADVQILAETKGGKCLSTVYINALTKLEWQCSEGHTWKAIFNSVQQGNWCPVCSRKKVWEKRRKNSKQKEREILLAFEGGATIKEIEKHFGYSTARINKILKKHKT